MKPRLVENFMYSQNRQWERIVHHASDLLTQDLVMTGMYKGSHFKEYGLSFDFPYALYDHSTGDVMWDKAQMDEIKVKPLSSEQYLHLIDSLRQVLSNYKDFLSRFEREMPFARSKPEIIREFFDESTRATSSVARFVLELGIETILVKENIPVESIGSAKTETMAAEETLRKIASDFSEEMNLSGSRVLSSELIKALQDFCERFGYLSMEYFLGHPWTIWEAYEMARSSTQRPNEVESDSPKVESEYLEYATELLKMRTEKWEVMCKGAYLFRKMVITYFSDLVFYDDLLSLRMEEAISVLSGALIHRDLIRQRKNFQLEIGDDGPTLSVMKGIASVHNPGLKSLDQVQGQTAYKGKVTGQVKVVMTSQEIGKVNPGDILVATMSTPDFLAGMMKAAAFVTDIGGITSHVAIVAREMRKPCVIGTKSATQVFKDGDMVEVDADNGIVKKV